MGCVSMQLSYASSVLANPERRNLNERQDRFLCNLWNRKIQGEIHLPGAENISRARDADRVRDRVAASDVLSICAWLSTRARIAVGTLIPAVPPVTNLIQRSRPHKCPIPELSYVGLAVVTKWVAARLFIISMPQNRLLDKAPVLKILARRDTTLVD